MFIHLGGDTIIRVSEIIAIFDLSAQNSSKISEEFLSNGSNRGNIIYIDQDELKSFVLTNDKIYYSPISSSTLKKRAGYIQHLDSGVEGSK